MKIDRKMSDGALLRLIGERLAGVRLEQNLSQRELAERAGLGVRTVQRLESGEAATHLSGFVRVCRILGLVEHLELLIPEPPVSPMAQLKLRGRKRKRASGAKAASARSNWAWGESPT